MTIPADDSGSSQPHATTGQPPKTVLYAFWTWIAAAAIAIFAAVLTFAFKQQLIDTLIANNRNSQLTPTQIAQGANSLVWLLLIVSVVAGALFVFFAYKARAGVPSARIVLTVLGALIVIFQYFFGSLIGLLSAVLVLVAIVLLWTPSTKEYFKVRQ